MAICGFGPNIGGKGGDPSVKVAYLTPWAALMATPVGMKLPSEPATEQVHATRQPVKLTEQIGDPGFARQATAPAPWQGIDWQVPGGERAGPGGPTSCAYTGRAWQHGR